jgi:hypothetical protein
LSNTFIIYAPWISPKIWWWGWVGINTNTPSNDLDVHGSVDVTGSINAWGTVSANNINTTTSINAWSYVNAVWYRVSGNPWISKTVNISLSGWTSTCTLIFTQWLLTYSDCP